MVKVGKWAFPKPGAARQHQVSCKFVYQQLHHAHDALDQAFTRRGLPPPQSTAAKAVSQRTASADSRYMAFPSIAKNGEKRR
jgi:hypothetical protein